MDCMIYLGKRLHLGFAHLRALDHWEQHFASLPCAQLHISGRAQQQAPEENDSVARM
jgi:hypothetical protein